MSKPDNISNDYSLVNFSGKNLREIVVRLLNWMEEPAGGTYTKPDGTKGYLNYTNEFYCLPETIRVEYDSEYGYYSVDIICGRIPNE